MTRAEELRALPARVEAVRASASEEELAALDYCAALLSALIAREEYHGR